MAERIETADAPPPPPPPPPDDGPRNQAPEVTSELADALAQERQDGSGESGVREHARERPEPESPGLADRADVGVRQPETAETAGEAGDHRGSRNDPEVSPELASALSETDPSSSAAAEAGPEASGPRFTDQPQQTETPLTGRGTSDEARGGTDRPDDSTRGGQDNPVTGRPDMASNRPDDYVPTPGPLPEVGKAHENPQNWVADINPDRAAEARKNNCGECARAVDSCWNGQPAVAAALARPEEAEFVSVMTDWAGEAPVPVTMSEVDQRLRDLGPGSSAVVGCDWKGSEDGHWFNAVNDGGTIKAVDGQAGIIETWPPSIEGVGFHEDQMSNPDAIFFTPDGKVVKN